MSNQVQNNDIQFRGYLTAFIDLLGISTKLLELEKISEFDLGNIPEDFKKEAVRTAVSAEWLRSGFYEFYKGYSSPESQQPPAPLNEKQMEVWNRQFPDPPTIQWFSDCILISIPIKPEWPTSVYISLHSLAMACAITQLRAVGLQIPVRGAISLGYGACLNTGEVLGAGLVKAYQMESKEAVYPRIIIDPDLIDVVKPPSKPQEDWLPGEFDIVNAFWGQFMESLVRNQDGYWHVDFLNTRFLEMLQDADGKTLTASLNLIDEAMIPYFSEEIYPLNATPANRKHFAKWTWLANYWKQRRADVVKLLEKRTESSRNDK